MAHARIPTWEDTMAGKGPPPKDPNRRVRRNNDGPAFRVVETEPDAQPELPTIEVEADGDMTEFVWPARTVEWWENWRTFPLAEEFTTSDWDFLLDTALIHAKYWQGNTSVAGELRLRVAKFGVTPEDRARLRITFAQADEAEERRGPKGPSARDRRRGLRSVPPPSASSE